MYLVKLGGFDLCIGWNTCHKTLRQLQAAFRPKLQRFGKERIESKCGVHVF